MINTSNLKYFKIFVLFTLLFIFIPACYIPETNVPIYDIIVGIFMFVFAVLFPRYFTDKIKNLFKYKHTCALILFVLWVFFVGVLMLTLGRYRVHHFLYATFLLFFYNNILWYLYPSMVFPKIFPVRFLIKFMFLGIYILCVYGLLVYLFNVLGINALNYIQDIINNRREEIVQFRVLSVFEEPSNFGYFIACNLSLLYTLITSKYKIFDNKFLNLFIKKTYIPLLAITIIFIQSPIWLPFFCIITFVHFFKPLVRFIKQKFIYVLVSLILFMCGLSISFVKFSQIDVSQTFLNRIVMVSKTFTNWDLLVRAEPSLANRLLSYYLRVKIFLKNPITGVGYKNAEYQVLPFINHATFTLTREAEGYIKSEALINGYMRINGTILTILLADTGLVGAILYFLFVILSIKKITKIRKLLRNKNNIESEFFLGIRNAYISILCLSIYGSGLNIIYTWFLYGITNTIIYDFKEKEIIYQKECKYIKTTNKCEGYNSDK